MLKVDIPGRGQPVRVEFGGELASIMYDTAWVVSSVYKCLSQNDPATGELFKRAWTELAIDEESPLWDDPHESVVVDLSALGERGEEAEP